MVRKIRIKDNDSSFDFSNDNNNIHDSTNISVPNIEIVNPLSNDILLEQLEKNCEYAFRNKIIEIPIMKLHNNYAILVGGSESYKKDYIFYTLKKFYSEKNNFIFCSKTSHDYLIENEIIPFGCVILDPRMHVLKSFKCCRKVKYFVSAFVNPDVIVNLFENKCKIFLYFPDIGINLEKVVPKYFNTFRIVPGGSTSMTRSLVLLTHLGFYKYRLFGLDASYSSEPKEVFGINKNKKPFLVDVKNNFGNRKESFWTDSELFAQINEIGYTLNVLPFLRLECHSEGLLKFVFESYTSIITKKNFNEYFL